MPPRRNNSIIVPAETSRAKGGAPLDDLPAYRKLTPDRFAIFYCQIVDSLSTVRIAPSDKWILVITGLPFRWCPDLKNFFARTFATFAVKSYKIMNRKDHQERKVRAKGCTEDTTPSSLDLVWLYPSGVGFENELLKDFSIAGG